MPNERFDKLIESLLLKTRAKEAIWNKSSKTNEFKLVLAEGLAITIAFYSGQYEHEFSYVVSVFNKSGDRIQRIDTEHEAANTVQLDELYKLANDQYYRVDETFDALIKVLNKQGTVGTKDNEQEQDDLPF